MNPEPVLVSKRSDAWIAAHVVGYQATSQRRRQIRQGWVIAQAALGNERTTKECPLELPDYLPHDREAWALYTAKNRANGGGGLGRTPGRRRDDVEHGTIERYRQHLRERALFRAQGRSAAAIELLAPIDPKCKKAASWYNALNSHGTTKPRA